MTRPEEESPSELEARRLFEQGLSLTVDRIPATTRKTADYVVHGEEPGYVVEVKTRYGDEEARRDLQEQGSAVVQQSASFHRWSVDAARAARKQMRDLDPGTHRWWVLWLSVQTEFAGAVVFDQIVGSLYGVRQVVFWAGEEAISRDCVGAVTGAFEKYPEIDAVIVSHGDGLRFCVNDLRPDEKGFTSSSLHQRFAHMHPPISAGELTANRGFLRVESTDVSRGDEKALRTYLESKYGLRGVQICDMKVFTAAANVEREKGA